MKRHNGYIFWVLLLVTTVNSIYSQTPDVFRIEYMIMPENSGNIETSRIKLVLNVPIAVGEKNDYVILGAEYNRYNFEVPDDLFPNSNDLNKFHVVDVNLAYMYKLSEKWRLIGVITPRWSSNFVEEFQQDDFNMNFTAGTYKNIKDVEKPFILALGISYNSTSPIDIPLPFLYYEKRFHPNWSYVVGAPKSGMKYFTKKGHFFQTELFLDGYYVNIQNDILLPGNNLSTDVSSTALLLTLGYQYKITKDMSVYIIGGRSLFQNGVLRDEERNDIFTLNDATGLYFRTGFRIGI
ncbi:DUF6268 family outer membrane beta-barrel protein [Maribacter hydrothermalis]|uniref:DUF6268 domain-containing protein n=1 Tax=Maribacter hydrothermalis TaxID=1836467 RepID=A0A1B7Z1G0_9FLAO|nr:DUF6268 family outer membrane beta-barrel protein [Maribacter hydrothermalis]APQ18215.1 hypothetical protein BTR34_13165 [Maribacter hydrothermalis]OBR36562.1 hypothetical protein A9200_09055 [Maribacter hydrothermalis]